MTSGSVLDRHDLLLLDLDGTVYHGAAPIPAAVRGIAAARSAGVSVRFVTNNASKTPSDVAAHLRALGVDADPAGIATSAQAAARLLASKVPAGADVLVVGTNALVTEVSSCGLRAIRRASEATAGVVQGHSPETCWADLAEACLAVRAGAVWVACNVDPTLPTERGQLPGNGSMVAALKTALRLEPLVAGKPAPTLFSSAASPGSRPLVIGDRLDTDIAGAVAAGMPSMLVMTGVTTVADLILAPVGQRPTYVARDLSAVEDDLEALAVGADSSSPRVPDDGKLDAIESSDALEVVRKLCGYAWRGSDHAERALHAWEQVSDRLPLDEWNR